MYVPQDVYVPGLDAPNGVETEADVVALLTEAGWDAYVVGDNKIDVITNDALPPDSVCASCTLALHTSKYCGTSECPHTPGAALPDRC